MYKNCTEFHLNLNHEATETAPGLRLKLHRTCTKNYINFHQKPHQEEIAPDRCRDCTRADLEYRKKRQHRGPWVYGF